MADKAPSTTKLQEPTDTVADSGEKKEEQKKLPQLGALEDDDEFEEFSTEGTSRSLAPLAHADGGAGVASLRLIVKRCHVKTGSIAEALAKAGNGDQLWEADWDDEDIEDDFAKKLRTAIQEKNSGDVTMNQ